MPKHIRFSVSTLKRLRLGLWPVGLAFGTASSKATVPRVPVDQGTT
ncbi:MAG: hypothetical protein KGI25_04960 [Thaumarchaeota archaeon]|nr:hypothetical protein [Nitrososphaerota archaeon]